jgi:DMSO/TMAO reductase YedYZ molybdopterin-dependent catalytic subunit
MKVKNTARNFAAALMLSMALISGCATKTPEPGASQLQSVEVRNYQGQRLDSIVKFEENSIKGPQHVNISNYKLVIGGLVDNPINLTYDQVLSLPSYQKVVTIHCVEGWDVKILWEGVRLEDLLNKAEIKPGANTVIFIAYDGYSTSLPLDDVKNKHLILAYKMNNVTLPPERGYPFQVVAEDKWGYKWAKWVTAIALSNDSNYKGFWETQGYNQKGDLNGPIFERK